MKAWLRRRIEKHHTVTLDGSYGLPEGMFEGKVAVITGGTGEIGTAISERIIAGGGRCVCIGRTIPAQSRGGIQYIYWDLADLSDMEKKFEECLACFGRIDIWINNAGYISQNDLHGSFFEASFQDWEEQMQVNCKALFFLSQMAVRYFLKNKISGRIVQVLSIGGIINTWQPYGISKRAAMIFTNGLSNLLSDSNIRVFGVAPGHVYTKMICDMTAEENLSWRSSPNGRMATREEIANIVCYLAGGKMDGLCGLVVCDGGSSLL